VIVCLFHRITFMLGWFRNSSSDSKQAHMTITGSFGSIVNISDKADVQGIQYVYCIAPCCTVDFH